MRRLARLWFIAFTVLRFGLDEVALQSFRQPWVRLLVRIVTVGRDLNAPRGVRLRQALERLGPIFVKFGQVLSTRRDLVPPDLADELARLQDRVPPFPAAQSAALVERALGQAALWSEVKDRLHAPGVSLSGGQQQRLCIARALAVEPAVLLMDEPCSALDPIATARIEDLIHVLRERYTIVIVTHSMQQAARVSTQTAFFLMGELVEVSATARIFSSPQDPRTEDYITGRFG